MHAVLFDFDGTLVNSLAPTFQAFNFGLTQFGHPGLTDDEIVAHFGPSEEKIFLKLLGPENGREGYAAFRAYLSNNLHQVPLHTGVRELLDGLASRNTPVGIVTGRSSDTTHLILDHHGIRDRFQVIICNDHVDRPKPFPDGILLALKRLGIPASASVYYIGDSWVDMHAAKSAQVRAVAALWDLLARKEELADAGPTHLCDLPGDLAAILEALQSG